MSSDELRQHCTRTGMFEGLGWRLWNDHVPLEYIGAIFGSAFDNIQEGSYSWSNELALAASYYLKDLEGCNVYQPLVIDDGEANDYLT